jgi:hypothetical protein
LILKAMNPKPKIKKKSFVAELKGILIPKDIDQRKKSKQDLHTKKKLLLWSFAGLVVGFQKILITKKRGITISWKNINEGQKLPLYIDRSCN